MLFTKSEYTVKVNAIDCLYIETWVRTMDEIPNHLKMLKEKVAECNQKVYDREVARTQALSDKNTALAGEEGAQGLLNDIIANLNFD